MIVVVADGTWISKTLGSPLPCLLANAGLSDYKKKDYNKI